MNISEKVIDIVKGMEGIGGTPTDQEFLNEFEFRLQALKLGQTLPIDSVTKRYLFWFESEGKDGWTFEIEAEDSNDAYDKAYDTHGPQVAGMMYQVI